MSLDNLTNSMEAINHSISQKSQGFPALFEISGQAPAPNQTYFHLGVYDESPTQPVTLILTGFPRKRLSQSWSRDRYWFLLNHSNMNPFEKIITVKEFQKGDYHSEIVEIFGEGSMKKLKEFVNVLMAKKAADSQK